VLDALSFDAGDPPEESELQAVNASNDATKIATTLATSSPYPRAKGSEGPSSVASVQIRRESDEHAAPRSWAIVGDYARPARRGITAMMRRCRA